MTFCTSKLMAWVEAHEHSLGRRVSILYSDIPPEYYARLGYVRCAAHEAWAELKETETPNSGRLVPLDPREEIDELATWYRNERRVPAPPGEPPAQSINIPPDVAEALAMLGSNSEGIDTLAQSLI